MKQTGKLFFLLFITFLVTITCHVDYGITPLPGKVAVTVIFRGTPPQNTQGIYLVVAPTFPPHAINDLHHNPNSLPIEIGLDTVYTEMVLPFGQYESISLWWYSTETKSNLADMLAMPLDANNNLMPLGFELSSGNPVFQIVLYADWKKVNRDAFLEGTIYFNGPYPDNTLATAIAAYLKKPEKSVDYLIYLKSMDFGVEGHPYHFKLPVRHGNINYLAVFWLSENSDLTDFKTIGVYEDPNDPGTPATLRLDENETVTGIDIYADWSRIK